ncbi:acyltransferase family protein [uncultured Eubacterium sp.]|uniref:acyltransferase family protein n=1 Tax=uncultured Eubacterium sp. TaxID=165185 RepID=UPI00262EF576|nr:acyltransferase family protein [uncultured Eubacterium sp.]
MNNLLLKNKFINDQRNSALEILRIISMLMIVFHHFAYHGNFQWETNFITIPHLWYNFIVLWGKLGVNLFVLISGYFLINDKDSSIHIKKTLKFLGQVVFYSVLIYFLFVIFKGESLNVESVIKAFFPITFQNWWFASTYFLLFLIHPFLNIGLIALDKKSYQKFIILFVFIWSVLLTITSKTYQVNDFVWFVLLYAVAGYARLYGFNKKILSKHYFILAFIIMFITYLATNYITFLGTKNVIDKGYELYFSDMQKTTTLFSAVCLFMAFVKMKPFYNKEVNIISSATFGVYLLHDSNYTRTFLWTDLFKNSNYQGTVMLIPYSIFVVFFVYVVCVIIDLIRQYTVEKVYMLFVNKISKPIKSIFNKVFVLIENLFF